MSRNSVTTRARAEDVFDVLDDACAYPRWVVGTRRVRHVDANWPDIGACFHHAIGAPGAELHDSSKVLVRERATHMVLEVRFRPTGVARVDIRLTPETDGCTIILEETPIGGPMARLPRVITDPLLAVRNAVSLQRVRHEVERAADAASCP